MGNMPPSGHSVCAELGFLGFVVFVFGVFLLLFFGIFFFFLLFCFLILPSLET